MFRTSTVLIKILALIWLTRNIGKTDFLDLDLPDPTIQVLHQFWECHLPWLHNREDIQCSQAEYNPYSVGWCQLYGWTSTKISHKCCWIYFSTRWDSEFHKRNAFPPFFKYFQDLPITCTSFSRMMIYSCSILNGEDTTMFTGKMLGGKWRF